MYFVALFFFLRSQLVKSGTWYRLTGDSCLHCKKSASRGMSLHGNPPPPPCLGGKKKPRRTFGTPPRVDCG